MVKAVFFMYYAITWILGFAYMQGFAAPLLFETFEEGCDKTVINKLKVKAVYGSFCQYSEIINPEQMLVRQSKSFCSYAT